MIVYRPHADVVHRCMPPVRHRHFLTGVEDHRPFGQIVPEFEWVAGAEIRDQHGRPTGALTPDAVPTEPVGTLWRCDDCSRLWQSYLCSLQRGEVGRRHEWVPASFWQRFGRKFGPILAGDSA